MLLLRSSREDRPPFAFPTKEAVREARELGPEFAAEAVAAVLASYEPGGDVALASRAAGLVHELQLEDAIPSLLACIERLPDGDRVTLVCVVTLDLLGPVRFPQLLEAFTRATDPVVRWRLGMSLCLARKGTLGVREALERMLETEPADAAALLAHHGDRNALPTLRGALDRLELPSPGTDELPALERIINVGHAILELRGTLTRSRREKVDRANARYDALVEGGVMLTAHTRTTEGPACRPKTR
jgi:hypothetical protein